MPEEPVEVAAAELADVYAGSWWESEGERVIAFTHDAVRHGEALRRRTGASFAVRAARFTRAELEALAERIAADADLLEAEGVGWLGHAVDEPRNRVRLELVTGRPAETLAWLYERYGDALWVDVVGSAIYEAALAVSTGYRAASGEAAIELRYARGGELVRVEVVEHDDVVAVGIAESRRLGVHAMIHVEAWARAELGAPLGERRVRDAASGRFVAPV